jgi:hypothetical protein
MEGLENVFKGDVTLRQALGKNFQMFSSPLGDFCFFLPGGGEELWVHHGYGCLLRTILQAGVEAEMEAAGAAARSEGGVRVAATQRLVDLSGDEEKWGVLGVKYQDPQNVTPRKTLPLRW